MRKVVIACLLGAALLGVVAAACGGVTNQTTTPGQGTATSAAALPSVSATPTPSGGGTPTGGTGGNAAAGKAVYAANCASCHGATGGGGIGPDLVTLKLSYGIVQKQVTNGGAQGPDPTPGTGGVVMPAFKGTLTPTQINDVSAFVAGGLKD
jgi:mono/diheme cytochrome c family protein